MTLSEMVTRCSERLNEGATGPVFYPRREIIAALNEGLRLFVLLTLCLETTQPWDVPAATTFFHMLSEFPDWIVPLRVATTAGAKIRPIGVDGLASLNPGWMNASGDPVRYASLGADFLALYKQSASGTTLQVTYARSPVPLVIDGDVPEIRTQYHPSLIEYGIYRLRQVEGGQEFAKVLEGLNAFLDAAQHEAAYVRARNLGARYDKLPFELGSFDRSKLLRLRKDLVPNRKVEV